MTSNTDKKEPPVIIQVGSSDPGVNAGANVRTLPPQQPPRRSILLAMAERYSMEPDAFEATVRATCFPASPPATREEFAAGMQIAHKLELNPLTKELHFARLKGGGVQAIIGVDGWYTMANKHPQYDGCEFDPIKDDKGAVTEIVCKIYRKDRSRPTIVSELMVECRRQTEPWKLTPTRMLRHRAFGQCARLAFAFAGVIDQDEYDRWQEMKDVTPRKSAAVLEVPDLPDEPETITAAEASQEAQPELLADAQGYLANLEENLVIAADEETIAEVWWSHLELVDRLSPGDAERAERLHQKHAKRVAKRKGG